MNSEWVRELRQRNLVRTVLDEYQAHELPLRRLVQDLQALSCEMTLAPAQWRELFQAEVNGLEVLYAIAIDREVLDDLPEDFRANVEAGVKNIGELMESLENLPIERGGH
jgi:hypothetical protein